MRYTLTKNYSKRTDDIIRWNNNIKNEKIKRISMTFSLKSYVQRIYTWPARHLRHCIINKRVEVLTSKIKVMVGCFVETVMNINTIARKIRDRADGVCTNASDKTQKAAFVKSLRAWQQHHKSLWSTSARAIKRGRVRNWDDYAQNSPSPLLYFIGRDDTCRCQNSIVMLLLILPYPYVCL